MSIKLSTDLLKADMPYPFSKKSKKIYNELHTLYENGSEKALPKIMQATANFTTEPHFLALAARIYEERGVYEKVNEINDKIRELFPLSLSARLYDCRLAFKNNEPERAKDLLGSELTLESLFSERKAFHYSEYLDYMKMVMLYHRATGNENEVTRLLIEASSLAKSYDFEIDLLHELAAMSLEYIPGKLPVESLPPLPDFKCKEIEQLYQYDYDIPDEVYNAVLENERGLLIDDIEKLLQHSIEFFPLFRSDEMPGENTLFVLHALFLLKDIEAAESLPAVLNFLKQDEEIIAFYLGSDINEFLWEILYTLGKDQLRLLVNTCKEIPDDWLVRSEIAETLKQIALYNPEKRVEIESYLRELLLFVTTVTFEEDIYIDDLTDNVLEAIGEGGFRRLFGDVQRLFEEEKLPVLSYINWESFKEDYDTEDYDPEDYKKEFKSRQEVYEECLASEEFSAGDFDDDGYNEDDAEIDDYLQTLDEEDAYEDAMEVLENKAPSEDDTKKNYVNYTEVSATPFVKTEPDVGRNDPCPCGSGKKYKKCHGKS